MRPSSLFILIVCCTFDGQIGSGQEVQLTDQVENDFHQSVRVVSSWFEDEDMVSCVNCDGQSDPTSINTISALWLRIQDAVVNLPKTLETNSPRKKSGRWALYWPWVFLEFSLGAVVCFLMAICIASLATVRYEWTGTPTEEHFYDAPSSDVTIIEKDVPKFFPNNRNILDELEVRESQENYNGERREIVMPKVIESNEKVDVHANHTSLLRSPRNCEQLSLFKPVRPAPPTVNVYNLHKPHEIPNDIMEALLCLKKNCEHDHAKIRLIGPKVFVYSTTKRQRVARAKKRMKKAFEFRQPWLPGETRKVIGKDVLSDDFELEEETTTVSTQTDNLTIRTRAYRREESEHGSHMPISGTVYFSTDHSWDDSEYSLIDLDERYTQMACSNVRENVVRSRPNIGQIELSLNDFDFEFGLPQANSSFHEDVSPRLAHNTECFPPRSLDFSGDSRFDSCLADQSTSSDTASIDVDNTFGLLQKRVRSMIPNTVTDLIPYRASFIPGETTLLDISRNMTYIGSNTAFYERLCMVLADCAIKKMRTYSSSINLSWVFSRQTSHPAKSRLNRTV